MKTKATPEQQAKAKERRAAFAELSRTLPKGDELQAIASDLFIQTVEGHDLSAVNTVLLTYQRENVTIVGGFQQWRTQGRAVTKGESALAIWIPRKEKEDPNNPASGTGQPGEITEKDLHPGFFMGYVFDITQTHIIESEI